MKFCQPLLIVYLSALAILPAVAETKLQDGVRGVATRAPKGMKIDGDLAEFKDAFATPVEYFQNQNPNRKDPNPGLKDRAAQFFYMWDDEAFYAGLRTLDRNPHSSADDAHLWEGDAVEWYFDTRQNDEFRSHDWPKTPNAGAVHCYWSGLKGTNVVPRFCLRPGFLEAIPKTGMEVGASRTAAGMEVEFKLPWANFPGFKAKEGVVIALDAELCYSDGGPRVFRSFVFGSPLNVQQPASLGKIQFVEKLSPEHWKNCGSVLFPIRCDTAWGQPGKPMVTGLMALPPNFSGDIGKVTFRVVDLDGKKLGEYDGKVEMFEPEGNFRRATAQWPVEIALPGVHQLLGVVYDKSGKELTRIAPRLVSVNMQPGY
ncbi:MAG: sugar-binding protein [Verrucomicrobiota bacterium]